jgi:hypothetical protein
VVRLEERLQILYLSRTLGSFEDSVDIPLRWRHLRTALGH